MPPFLPRIRMMSAGVVLEYCAGLPRTNVRLSPGSASTSVRENVMKALISMLAIALALAVTGPAFAGDITKATTKADCDKAGGM